MKRIILLIALLQILGIVQAVNVSTAIVPLPEPQVALGTITVPDNVLANQSFDVNVSVTYSCKQRTMSNIGIYDFGSEMIRDPRVFYLEGNGSKFFLFSFLAPPVEGDLKFEALLRYWYEGGWVYENESLREPFSIKVSDEIQMHIILPAPGSKIKIDGAEKITDRSGVFTSAVQPGRHLVYVPREISLTNDTRLSFLRWSDGSRSNPIVTEIQADLNLTAEYETEYYLTVKSSLGEPAGEGWYPSGSIATFSVPRSLRNSLLNPAEEIVFKKWSGDSDAATPTAQIFMSSPKNVEAQWQTSQTSSQMSSFALIIPISLIIMIIDVIIISYFILKRRHSRLG